MNKRAGFTIAELMVVVSIIGIIAAFIIPNINQSTGDSRDAERKTTLRTLQGALELYKHEYGRYPEACNGGATDWSGVWSGEVGTDYECGDGTGEYIRDDLAGTVGVTENFTPQFIPVLPRDPFLNGATDAGYVYATNPEGTVYKLMSMNGAENEVVTYKSPFARCGDMNLGIQNECTAVPSGPTGNQAYNTVGSTPNQCNTASIYDNDYAVRGGYAPGGFSGFYRETDRAREYFSDAIRCK